jgi:hypothetical protein
MNFKYFALIITILILGVAAVNAVSLSTVPNPEVSPVSQSFQLQVQLDTATSIRGYSIYFGFNQSIVHFDSATRGTLFTGQPVGWWNVTNVSPGVVRVECIIFGEGLTVTGPGIILNVNFTGLIEGYSQFSFNQVELYDVTGAIIPNVATTAGNILIGGNLAYMTSKCYLEGPYNDGHMSTALNARLPLESPYTADSVTVTAMPSDVVDWLLLELRQTYNGTAYRVQSVFLHSDGTITSPGKSFILFNNTSPGTYYVVIRHRNHLAIMSSAAVSVAGSGTFPFYDFSLLSNIYGTGSTVTLDNGLEGMAAGDADMSGVVGQVDRIDFWRIQAGRSGYLSADFNLDGNVFPDDLNKFWRINLGMVSDVP